MSGQVKCHRRHTIERWTVDCRDGGTLVTFTMDEGYCPTCGAKLERNGTVTPMVPAATDDADYKWAEKMQPLAERMAELNLSNANCEGETECKLGDLMLTALQAMRYWISTARNLERRLKLSEAAIAARPTQ